MKKESKKHEAKERSEGKYIVSEAKKIEHCAERLVKMNTPKHHKKGK